MRLTKEQKDRIAAFATDASSLGSSPARDEARELFGTALEAYNQLEEALDEAEDYVAELEAKIP